MRTTLLLAAALSAMLAPPAIAQVENSRPEAVPIAETIPPARDIPFAGTMTLDVDATDTERGIFRVRQTIPVAQAGPMVLLFPEWLPGNHAPRGPIAQLAGLHIRGNGNDIVWRRDPVDVYAFHVDVPEGVAQLELEFQHLSPTASDQGRIVMTPEMLNLQWEKMSLYPAGYYVRNIMVTPSVTLPQGWHGATALSPTGTSEGNRIAYRTVPYEVLVDSPMFAGAHYRRADLGQDVTLNIFADNASELAATDEQIAAHRRLVDQSVRVFGSRHFDRYEFLLAISDHMSGIGLEHHRSSENGVGLGYFLDWDDGPGDRDLLPHEVTHSWNGKFRRPAAMWTPDYRTPMQDDLLWVYEGQTQFWGYVLSARSGLLTPDQTRESLALIAAGMENRVARSWRPLEDTTHDPIIAARRPKGWTSWQRSEDYYNEGLLIWLEADQIIRRESGGRRSLDDFARAFFGVRDGDWGQLTYSFDDVVAALNAVQPYDWAGHLRTRIEARTSAAPLEGLRLGGYRLGWADEPSQTLKQAQDLNGYTNLSWSGGLSVENDGRVSEVIWDSAAFNAGLTVGSTIVAVNDHAYSGEFLRDAIAAAADPANRVDLLVRTGDRYRTVRLEWRGGLRYPVLERAGSGTAGLDRLLQALR